MSSLKIKPINFAAARESIPDVDAVLSIVDNVAKKTNTPRQVFPADQPVVATPVAEKPAEPPRTEFKRFTVELPAYLVDDIENRAKGKTRRYVAMKAFKDAGFFVNDTDMKEDFRGRRS